MKTCRRCLVEKPADRFSPTKKNRDGLQSYCKECNAAYARATNNPERNKRTNLKRLYNLSLEAYEALVIIQDGLCACCGEKPPLITRKDGVEWDRLHVDHDHNTGRIRGLVCVKCNRLFTEGWDNAPALCKAIAYLAKGI